MKKTYIRILLGDFKKFTGNFKAFLQSEEIVHVLGVNGVTMCCDKNKQILYFIKKKNMVTDEDIKLLTVTNIELDFSFEINCDLFEYERKINQ